MKKYVLLAIGLSFVFSMSAQAKSGESLMSIQRSFREDANVEEPVLEMKGRIGNRTTYDFCRFRKYSSDFVDF